MLSYTQRSTGLGSLGLSRLVSTRTRRRGSNRGPKILPLQSSVIANAEIDLNLLAAAVHPDGYGVRVWRIHDALRGQARSVGKGVTRYRSPKLFIGQDRLTFEVVDDSGLRVIGSIAIEVDPNPEIGRPFGDDTFFEDETGWSLEGE